MRTIDLIRFSTMVDKKGLSPDETCTKFLLTDSLPAGTFLFKLNNRNIRTLYKVKHVVLVFYC